MADTSFFNKTGTPPNDPSQFTVDDHGLLSGLADDDHPQYHNDTRGDARYYTKSQVDSSLSGKAASSHTHAISDTTGLQTALDGKASTSHSHAISDVTDLQTSLDGKASSSHTHAISDVTNLQTTLDGKASSSHSHAISDVTNLQTTLDGKAATSHTHAISDTTGLQTALDGKAASSHTHTAANITDFSEAVDDRVGTLVTAGTGISVSYNDGAGTLTISASGGSGTGDVVGPASAVNNRFAAFDGTTGKLIKDSGSSASSFASASHTHAISDVTNLQTSLDAKADVSGEVFTGTVEAPDFKLTGGPVLKTGSGSPQGVVTAPVGSLYTRTDGGTYSTLYVKTSGSGNTGWSALGPLAGATWSDA